MITILYHPLTGVDLEDLEMKLNQHKSRKLIIGAFSAASNVTGMKLGNLSLLKLIVSCL